MDEGDFGAVSLLVVLAERIDPRLALAAATGWGGDAYAVFPKDGRTCIRARRHRRRRRRTGELADALTLWVARPAGRGTATTSTTGIWSTWSRATPVRRRPGGTGGSADALDLAVTRSYVAADALDGGADPDAARCFGSVLVNGLTDEELAADEATPAVERKVAALAATCR